MEQPLFHVMLDGRKLGPYDRRTIVGMRIKKALDSDHVLTDSAGMELTVADLIGRVPRSNDFSPNRTGGFSIVQATYPASLTSVKGRGMGIPSFRGEVEARVQTDVLRIAGRFRHRLRWKEGRVKLPLADILHAGAQGTQVELGLGQEGQVQQRVVLELFTAEAAADLVAWLPRARPWPSADVPKAAVPVTGQHMLWVPVVGAVLAVGVVMAVLLYRRVY